MFWAVGVFSWAYAHGWAGIEQWLAPIDNTAACIALATAGLLLAGVSATAGRWCERPAIRICEGYWFGWPGRFRSRLVKRVEEKRASLQDRWDELETKAINRIALTYGDMIRAAFDLHRFRLYEAMKFPLPTSIHAEAEAGIRLTEYLLRRTLKSDVIFERGGKAS